MQVTIERVARQDKMPPRQGEQGPGSIAWRLVCKAEDGTEHCVWVRSEDSERGRVYAEGQQWDVTFNGGDVEDRDGSKWKKSKFDKVGSGGGNYRKGGGGGQQSSGGQQARSASSSGGSRDWPGKPQPAELARDIYTEKVFALFFANLAIGRGLRQAKEDPCSDDRLEEMAGKITNMQVMDMNLRSLKLTAAKLTESVEAERQRKEAEEAKAKAEAEEKKRLEEQARLKAASTGETLDI